MELFRSPLRSLVIAAVVAAGAWAAVTLRLETELLPLLPPELPGVQGLAAYERGFASDREVIVVADAAGLDLARRGPVMAAARERLARVPGVESVAAPGFAGLGDLAEVLGWVWWNLPPETFDRLAAALEPDRVRARLESLPDAMQGALDPEELARLRLDPLGLLAAAGAGAGGGAWPGRMTADAVPGAWVVRFRDPVVTFDECQAAVDGVRAALDAAVPGASERAALLITGRPAITAEISAQMQRDMMLMIGVALALVTGAFWLFYRTLRPLGWVLFFQMLSVLAAALVARVAFGELNVISMGFASILMGVSLDYCILAYHHFASPERADAAAWRGLRRGIWFSAVTTAASFLVLAFSSFPGLRQLAALVATGLLTTALWATWFLPVVFGASCPAAPRRMTDWSERAAAWLERRRGWLLLGTGAVLAAAAWLAPWRNAAAFYTGDLAQFRPDSSEAWRGQALLAAGDPDWRDAIEIVRAPDGDAARAVSTDLAKRAGAADNAWSALLPSERHASVNASRWAAGSADRVAAAFEAAGLDGSWSATTVGAVRALDRLASGGPPPAALGALWRRDATGITALVRVSGAADHPPEAPGALPVSWVTLKEQVASAAWSDMKRLGLWMLAAIVVLCAVAQRSPGLVLLNLAALAVSLSLLAVLLRATQTVMSPLALLCVPLLIGLVIDYSLHVLMGLERERGDLRSTYRHLAPPILLTGLASCIGFGAPMLTSQPALRNFGLVMDLGIVAAVAVGLGLLPAWHAVARGGDYTRDVFYKVFYRPGGFAWAVGVAAVLGRRGAHGLARLFGLGYVLTHPAARRVIRDNLRLLDPGRGGPADQLRLYVNQSINFAEYGVLTRRDDDYCLQLAKHRRGLEFLQRAQASGKGCLLVTGHLGFFELGGLVISRMGFPLTALTLPEPTPELTKWRADFRGRWGVGTIEVGTGPFASVEIVRELRAGKFIAMLADRPFDDNWVEVDLPHGRTRFASAPVLLSLMAGCPIIPVATLREPDGTYRIEAYDYLEPKWLPVGRDETIRHFTRELAARLVPVIARYADQWYQFVPAAVPDRHDGPG